MDSQSGREVAFEKWVDRQPELAYRDRERTAEDIRCRASWVGGFAAGRAELEEALRVLVEAYESWELAACTYLHEHPEGHEFSEVVTDALALLPDRDSAGDES